MKLRKHLLAPFTTVSLSFVPTRWSEEVGYTLFAHNIMKSSVPEYIPPGRGASSWITRSPHQHHNYEEHHDGRDNNNVLHNAFYHNSQYASMKREKPKAELLIQPQRSQSLNQTDVRRNHYSTKSERVGLKVHFNAQDNMTISNQSPALITPTFSELSNCEYQNHQDLCEDGSSRDDHSVGGNSIMSASRKLLKQSARKDHQSQKRSLIKSKEGNIDWQTSIPPQDEMGFPHSSLVNTGENTSRMRPRSKYQIAQESMELISYPIGKRNECDDRLHSRPPRVQNTNKNVHDGNVNKNNESHSREKSSTSLGIQTSHDEMSPLVRQGKTFVCHALNDESRRISSLAVDVRLSDQSMDTKHSSTVAIRDEKYDANKEKEKHKYKSNSSYQTQADKFTPIKIGRGRERVRFDQSWAQSPIAPEGSFDIFHDSIEQTSPEVKLEHNNVQQGDFMKVVAAIVIQTFFRRHLAYKWTCRRYRAVLLIQQFCHQYLRMKKDESMELRHSRHRMYDVAAMQIQAAWRGFWVRDCILVDNYCATLIQKLFRGHLARSCYGYDLYRITMSQSVVRRFLVQSSLRRDRAATIIQAHWRGYAGVKLFINRLADILIVQSVCRRWLVHHASKQDKQKKNYSTRMIKTSSTLAPLATNFSSNRERSLIDAPVIMKMPANWDHIAPNLISPSESVRSRSQELAQLDTDELIRQWKNRRHNQTRKCKRVELAEF